MAAKGHFLQRLRSGIRLCLALALAVFAVSLMTVPTLAQYFGRHGGGMFDSFFGPPRHYYGPPPDRQVDYSRAPAPRKPDATPTDNILVLGDSMADWLAFGLEDALGETPDFGVIRRHRTNSGLIRYDSRNENQDWAAAAREAISQTKPKFVVMMVGLNDRQSIRDRAPTPAAAAKPAQGQQQAPAQQNPPPQAPAQGATAPDADAERSSADQQAASEQASKGAPTGRTHEFHSDEWAEAYSKRVDATIAALKSGGVPVFWMGLPSVRGTKSTSDMMYLNELFRTRAEKAGIIFIDVWDGFVDESGRFTAQGPDFEGQNRRLRAGDGVHFTKAGARKLAHYLEREIRRVATRGTEPVALPAAEPSVPTPSGGPNAIARPLSGPVLPLTVSASGAQSLLGPGDMTPPPAATNAVTRVLVNGEPATPPAGRSDDFKWPRRGVAPFGSDPVVATTTEPLPVMKPAPETTVSAPASASTTTTAAGSTTTRRTVSRAPSQSYQPRRTYNGFSGFSFFPFMR